MHLSKYPVTSEKGIEYRVDVYDDEFGSTRVAIYTYVGKTKLFKQDKFEHLFGKIGYGAFDASKWGHNYVAMAKHQIKKYESLEEEERLESELKEEGISKFEEWNGKL